MKIFFSYAPEERLWIDELASRLVLDGLEVSSRETEVHLGEDPEDHFRRVFDAADFVVLIFTEQSASNPNILFELGVAMESGKPTLSLWITETGRAYQTPEFLKHRQLMEVRTPQEAAERIRVFISEQVAMA